MEDVEHVLRTLPAVLVGNAPDVHGLAESMRARIAFTFFALVEENFNLKGRGLVGTDGGTWEPLTPQYLAYTRPITGRGKPRAGKLYPGGKDGLLTRSQIELWWRTYRGNLAWLARKYDIQDAKSRAAAIATKTVRDAGGKFKIDDPDFGGRQVGKDYQIHVITGTFRRTIQPGMLAEDTAGAANYQSGEPDQIAEQRGDSLLVGTNFRWAEALHNKRPLWPDELPLEWQDELAGALTSGVVMFVKLVEQGAV